MLWTLSLSAPVDYIEGHPFDLKKNGLDFYHLQPNAAGQAKPVSLKAGETLRDKFDFHAPERGTSNLPFRAFVDDVQLLRPIRFQKLPETSQAIKKPMLFVGSAAPDLSKISLQERGGDLAFEVYFLWAPKIVPKENNGLLIRVSDASGTLFDETFAKYQISELTRLKQITAEIFVLKGLDAALNIDRESFNYAHPHYQCDATWAALTSEQRAVHTAPRQFQLPFFRRCDNCFSAKNSAHDLTKGGFGIKSTWLRREARGVGPEVKAGTEEERPGGFGSFASFGAK